MDHPLTVLIVDDEIPIREELKSFAWEEHHAVLLGEAKNGDEALRFCRTCTPDVVITDISMPVMDGLALVRALKQELPAVKVILLTCHSDFHYAQEALQHGAIDYILKITMTDRHLQKALEKAKEAIDKEESHRGQLQNRVKYTQWRLLRYWMDSGTPEQREEGKRQLIAEGFSWEYPLVLSLLCTAGHEHDLPFTDMETLSYTGRMLKADPLVYAVLPFGAGKCLIVQSYPGSGSASAGLQQMIARGERLVADARRNLSIKFPFLRQEIRLFAAVSDTLCNDGQMVDTLRRLEHEQNLGFYEPAKAVFMLPADPVTGKAENFEELESAMRKAAKNPESLAAFICKELPERINRSRPDPVELKSLIAGWRREWYPHKSDPELAAAGRRIANADSLSVLIEELLDEAHSQPAHKSRYEIAHAKRLIGQRLAEELTVSQIASEVGLRDHYFGRLFRQETGESFNEYVMRLRMDKAVQLLTTTNLKVYEIAEQVGIPNYRYFYILFRKWTGATPTDYKKG